MSAKTGFDDPGEGARPEPEPISEWIAAGFAEGAAKVWRAWRTPIATARLWVDAGVSNGLTAFQWSAAGVTPTTVVSWRAIGIEAPEALRWHQFGADLEVARRERQQGHSPEQFLTRFPPQGPAMQMRMAGGGRWFMAHWRDSVNPQVMATYMQHGWIDDHALEWARRGIPASAAYLWHDLGVRPEEAERIVARGLSVEQVIRAWWQAGIPIDEVADWLAAGFSPAEALEQRGRGVTSDEAAALRALRVGESESEAAGRRPNGGLRQGPPPQFPAGPPPPDEEGCQLEITRAFSEAFTVDADGAIPAVDGANPKAVCVTHACGLSADSIMGRPSVKVESIQFLNDREAAVSFQVEPITQRGPRMNDWCGRAVLIDGIWKVARETFCQIVRMSGFACQ